MIIPFCQKYEIIDINSFEYYIATSDAIAPLKGFGVAVSLIEILVRTEDNIITPPLQAEIPVGLC